MSLSLRRDAVVACVKHRMAVRVGFSVAALTIGGSLFALLPLWYSPLAEKQPLLRYILSALTICLIGASCVCAFLSQYLPSLTLRETAEVTVVPDTFEEFAPAQA